jgi:hypothetical protein
VHYSSRDVLIKERSPYNPHNYWVLDMAPPQFKLAYIIPQTFPNFAKQGKRPPMSLEGGLSTGGE